jgi:hypothetical protein
MNQAEMLNTLSKKTGINIPDLIQEMHELKIIENEMLHFIQKKVYENRLQGAAWSPVDVISITLGVSMLLWLLILPIYMKEKMA